jgi:hypothetical protein
MSGSDQLLLVAALQDSLKDDNPPDYVKGPAEAHWNVGKGNFAKALALIEKDVSKEAAWVRAHLHRRRGKTAAAGDWYAKAERPPSTLDLDREWSEIAAGLLLKVQ